MNTCLYKYNKDDDKKNRPNNDSFEILNNNKKIHNIKQEY